MRKRDSAGLAIAPLFLRLVLAVVFIWAGLGKFMGTFEVRGEQAAILANYGVIPNPHAPSRAAPPINSDATDEPIAPTEETPSDDAEQSTGSDAGQQASLAVTRAATRLVALQADETPRVFATAADFPEPVEVRGYAGIVLALHSAIHPGFKSEDGLPRMQLWPDFDPDTDYDQWPRYAALAAAFTELVGGILILLGLLTRFSAFAIANVMLVAMWLTVIGPAIQSGNTRLGFLPDYPLFGTDQWTTLLFQFSLLGSALALLFAGPGTLSMDRLLLGGSRKAPPPPPPKPAQAKK